MPTTITLTEADANQLLALLAELPIKHLDTVTAVQQFLARKFQEGDPDAAQRQAQQAQAQAEAAARLEALATGSGSGAGLDGASIVKEPAAQ